MDLISPEQRLVNEAYAHLHKTGKPSISSSRTCIYGGWGCAFSPAIKNLIPEMEGYDAGHLLRNFSEHLHDWAKELNQAFAISVQQCHDLNRTSEHFLKDFDLNLKQLCEEENLTFPGDPRML